MSGGIGGKVRNDGWKVRSRRSCG